MGILSSTRQKLWPFTFHEVCPFHPKTTFLTLVTVFRFISIHSSLIEALFANDNASDGTDCTNYLSNHNSRTEIKLKITRFDEKLAQSESHTFGWKVSRNTRSHMITWSHDHTTNGNRSFFLALLHFAKQFSFSHFDVFFFLASDTHCSFFFVLAMASLSWLFLQH